VVFFSQQNSLKKTIKEMLPRSLITSRLLREAGKSVLLTFDDGPHPEITPRVLSLLEKYGARAIFFVVGQRIPKAPYLLKRIQEQGHIIGNHTYIHSNKRQPWFFAYLFDLLRCQAEIEKHAGNHPKFFRPAGGRISFTSLLIPRILGMRTINWSLEANDWRCRTTHQAQQAADRLIRRLTYGDIVLLHDDNPHVLEILDILLPIMRSREYDLFSGIDFL
jgi:peptidoglycan/xylan/chitin deacetylase (PgdA/CDA1 family)